MASKSKIYLFRGILVVLVLAAIELIGYAGLWINSRSMDILSNKNYFFIRDMLTGRNDPETLPRYLSLPHLGYIPHPGYKRHGVVQHNEDGYRGHKVERQRSDKLRVLCLGGSTTYGYGVDSPGQTYPAQLELLLTERIRSDSALSKKYKGAEVINAGIDAGTSAEELQQYIFKYRYYKPDVVIVQSGVNDAMLTSGEYSDFQLDYTDSRRLRFHIEPLPQPARFLMHSYFFSFLAIRLFYNDFADNGQDEFLSNGHQSFCRWSHIHMDSVIDGRRLDTYPFYQNTKSLYAEITADSSALVVLPNILNRTAASVTSKPRYIEVTQLNIDLSWQLAARYNGLAIPFTFDTLGDPSLWIGDDCHLNARGEQKKAAIIVPYVIGAIH